ncbi:sulfate/molybdate ABC transporter ATP-binding protein [Cognatilysobacter tabacisoli]|uniref:sulfate/molybdate ABC transporter ATP-binding protein n=1 Tax=Cognatilysobacter tabacisoli TaxID=2315424 RepID=UPI000E6B4E4A|nr:sulfate/molybdate ABC transporter ATP-binding protein [Lysobacter tabacisoli]
MELHLRALTKRYPGVAALDGIDLDIRAGELVALLGPSGSGKTTLLRVIAGLLHADGGQVLFGGRDATALSLRERNVGFVFQHYALFKHMTVAENIAFGLRSRPRRTRPDQETIARRVDELLALIQLPELGGRYPEQLSGGQKQRVALARALAIDPHVLLLDEPFGALDAKVRVELRRWLRRLHDRTGQTTLFVTHDQEEALELADRVVLLKDGRIEQVGTPAELYDAPASAFAFDFIGRASVLHGEVRDGQFRPAVATTVHLPCDAADGAATLYVRPHDAALQAHGDGVPAEVVAVHSAAGATRVEVSVGAGAPTLELSVPGDAAGAPAVGQRGVVSLRRYRVFGAG